MMLYRHAVSALRARLLAIVVTALLGGIASLVLGFTMTPRIDVVGYVDVARVFHVDAQGTISSEIVVHPVVLAGLVNSEVFFDASVAGSGSSHRVRVIARVPPRSDNLVISARAESANEGTQVLTEIVRRINTSHQALQQPTLERLQKRGAMLDAEQGELVRAREQLDRLLADVASGKVRDSMQSFLLISQRAQFNKELRELERIRQSTSDAIRQTQEHQTRLVGSLTAEPASILVPLAMGFVGAALSALLASAVAFGLAYRQAVRGP